MTPLTRQLEAMADGIEAAECLQLCQSLFGDEWRVMVKAIAKYIEWLEAQLETKR